MFLNLIVLQNTVPTSGGSPILSSSIRKRQRSGSDRDRDRDRSKRFAKSHPQTPENGNNSGNIQCEHSIIFLEYNKISLFHEYVLLNKLLYNH